MTLETAVSVAAAVCLAVLIVIFTKKRLFTALPIFFCYLLYGFCAAFAAAATQRYFPHLYIHEYIAEVCGDAVLYFIALAELQRNLARYNRASSFRWWPAILLVVLNGLILSGLSQWAIPYHFSIQWRFAAHTTQATATIELAGLLALIEWSMIRGFRWPDREFRIVSGFGFYAVVAMAAAILYSHRFTYTNGRFPWINLLDPVTALGVLIYWIHYFMFQDDGVARSEAERRNLVAVGDREERDSDNCRPAAHALESREISLF